MNNIIDIPRKTTKISTKVRKAIDVRVRKGLSIEASAKEAGLSRNGFAKALKRPGVQDYLEQVQTKFITDVAASKSIYKAQAFAVAADLMMNAKSENVKMRAVEFLASDGKVAGVNVAVQVNNSVPSQGYEYPRPNQKVYEIVDTVCEDDEAAQ